MGNLNIAGSYYCNVYSTGTLSAQSIVIQPGGSFTAGSGSSITLSGNQTTITVDSGGTFNASGLGITLAGGQLLTLAGPSATLGSLNVNLGAKFIDQATQFNTALNLTANAGGVFQASQGGTITTSATATVGGVMNLDGGTLLAATANLT